MQDIFDRLPHRQVTFFRKYRAYLNLVSHSEVGVTISLVRFGGL